MESADPTVVDTPVEPATHVADQVERRLNDTGAPASPDEAPSVPAPRTGTPRTAAHHDDDDEPWLAL